MVIINLKNTDFCKLLRLPVSPIIRIQYFHLTTVDFYAKTFPILHPCLENSTTGIAIVGIICSPLIEVGLIFLPKFGGDQPQYPHMFWRSWLRLTNSISRPTATEMQQDPKHNLAKCTLFQYLKPPWHL